LGGEVTQTDNRTILKTGDINESAITDAVADIIITDCKSYYINSKIRLPIDDTVSRHAFTCALLAFDHDTDKIIAKTVLDLSLTFNLDSFYDFKLQTLKNRWDEVVGLANENVSYLICKQTFTELLNFLISNIDCEMDDTIFMHIKEAATREDVKKLFSCTTLN
jgi:hypothetical protein